MQAKVLGFDWSPDNCARQAGVEAELAPQYRITDENRAGRGWILQGVPSDGAGATGRQTNREVEAGNLLASNFRDAGRERGHGANTGGRD